MYVVLKECYGVATESPVANVFWALYTRPTKFNFMQMPLYLFCCVFYFLVDIILTANCLVTFCLFSLYFGFSDLLSTLQL